MLRKFGLPTSTRVRQFIRSNIMGLIALFVALGGTAWALEFDSVKSRHIVDGAVKSVDVDIPAKIVRIGLEPHPCQSGEQAWRDGTPIGYGGPLGYSRDAAGIVHLQGVIVRCGQRASNRQLDPVFTLPEGYRPGVGIAYFLGQIVSPKVPEQVAIDSGSVQIGEKMTAGNAFSLEGISFRCRPSGEDGCP